MNRSRYTAGDAGLSVALRRFPARALQIRQLLDRDESFRGMCDDLAIAEQALAAADSLPDSIREQRRNEYVELVNGLTKEIGEALDRGKIVQIGRPPRS